MYNTDEIVEKINGDRKHVRLIIYFNFNADTIYRELEIDNKIKKLELSNFYQKKCSFSDIEITWVFNYL